MFVFFFLYDQGVSGRGRQRLRGLRTVVLGDSRFDVDMVGHDEALVTMFATAECGGDGGGVRNAFPVGDANVLIGWGTGDRSQGGEWEEVRFEVRDLHGTLMRGYEAAGLGQVFSCITNKKL